MYHNKTVIRIYPHIIKNNQVSESIRKWRMKSRCTKGKSKIQNHNRKRDEKEIKDFSYCKNIYSYLLLKVLDGRLPLYLCSERRDPSLDDAPPGRRMYSGQVILMSFPTIASGGLL